MLLQNLMIVAFVRFVDSHLDDPTSLLQHQGVQTHHKAEEANQIGDAVTTAAPWHRRRYNGHRRRGGQGGFPRRRGSDDPMVAWDDYATTVPAEEDQWECDKPDAGGENTFPENLMDGEYCCQWKMAGGEKVDRDHCFLDDGTPAPDPCASTTTTGNSVPQQSLNSHRVR